jgi:hypothetical protein
MPALTPRSRSFSIEQVATRHQERTFVVDAGAWGGAEFRPTRLFLWLGDRDLGHTRILPLHTQPKLLRMPRRRRHLQLGAVRMSYLGNPLVTMVLFGSRFVGSRLARRL